jgi:hypothetical protein
MLGGLFSLRALHLEYFDGYIYAGVTPVYVPPTPPPGLNPGFAEPRQMTMLPANGYEQMFNGMPEMMQDDYVRYNGHDFQFI